MPPIYRNLVKNVPANFRVLPVWTAGCMQEEYIFVMLFFVELFNIIKMKKIYLFLLCMAIVSGVMAKPHSVKQIMLQGELPKPVLLKSATIPAGPAAAPVTAWLDGSDIKIEFGCTLGNLTITVVNEQGFPVYQRTVNATAGNRLNISTRGWSNGNYTLLITNASGGYLEGQFVK